MLQVGDWTIGTLPDGGIAVEYRTLPEQPKRSPTIDDSAAKAWQKKGARLNVPAPTLKLAPTMGEPGS